ncbi:MAG TPA: hypothetical protein V6D25_13900 [Leptolyngbyaceae cyanobacterium]
MVRLRGNRAFAERLSTTRDRERREVEIHQPGVRGDEGVGEQRRKTVNCQLSTINYRNNLLTNISRVPEFSTISAETLEKECQRTNA